MTTVSDVYQVLDRFAPFASAEDWDNSGLLVGDKTAAVQKVGFALDLTEQTLNEAIREKLDLLVTHHPVIFHAKKALLAQDPLYAMVQAGVAVISIHTPFDAAAGGVNDVLADLLELSDIEVVESAVSPLPFVRVGSVLPCSARDFARFVAKKLHTTVRLGDCGKEIRRVAVCGGSAIEMVEDALRVGADVFVTGDCKHHELLDAVGAGISVVAAGHYETEAPAVETLRRLVQNAFPAIETVLLEQNNPFEFVSEKG